MTTPEDVLAAARTLAKRLKKPTSTHIFDGDVGNVRRIRKLCQADQAIREEAAAFITRQSAENERLRKELDERLEDLGRVIMACPMSPETRTAPAHIGVRVMRTRLDTAVEALRKIRDQPESHSDRNGSYSVGYSFHIVKSIAGKALAAATGEQ